MISHMYLSGDICGKVFSQFEERKKKNNNNRLLTKLLKCESLWSVAVQLHV